MTMPTASILRWMFPVVFLVAGCGDSISMLTKSLNGSSPNPEGSLGKDGSKPGKVSQLPGKGKREEEDREKGVVDDKMLIQVSHGSSVPFDGANPFFCAVWDYRIVSAGAEIKKHQPINLEQFPFFKDRVSQVDKNTIRFVSLSGYGRDGVVLQVPKGVQLEIAGSVRDCFEVSSLPIRASVKVIPEVQFKMAPIADNEIRIERFELKGNGRDRNDDAGERRH